MGGREIGENGVKRVYIIGTCAMLPVASDEHS